MQLTVKVLDVEVDTGRLGLVFESLLLVGSSQLLVSLRSLLSSANVELLALDLLLVELLDGLGGGLVVGKVDKAESASS